MKKYNIIYADPPWRFKNWSMNELATCGEKWARRMGRSPYNVMDDEDIYALAVEGIAAKDCVLFLWATYPKLQEALETVRRWGFTYKSVAFTWVKTNKAGFHFGLGYWTRGNPEICLLATRGRPIRVGNSVANLTMAPVGEHSAKPSIIREKIVELMGDLPRIELFARLPEPNLFGDTMAGWDVWGSEVESDIDIGSAT